MVILTITHGGPLLFTGLIGIVAAIAMLEFYRMALPERLMESRLAALCGGLMVFVPLVGDGGAALPSLVAALLLFFLLFLFRIQNIADAARDVSYAALAFAYIPLLLMHLVMLRQTTYGVQWLVVVMLIVMSNDSLAYYSGRALGRHRLYKLVSPNKSIEGAIGGVVGSILGTLLARFTFFPQLSLTDALLTAVFIGILGQTGDLFESLLKRSFGVKDSGTIFPGHGGILDRLDSIIFAAPATYYYATYFFKG
ncbi:phosphatidate cytidylyltransferase [Pelobacter propionicus]|uniref:Phosphatidate cytidylyltransferase n=1 Tax=Pelobacter propionicus (strain DSM 2379 / NBRC 103807 / OttBd1) TaxID=338966 RepID=A1AQN7_PELPD|nr:phosphatidate cytidylyltransferase [Pelobacter propionicus]ABK99657.1 phosphatidate cytidylyltransferase [Pelobacter propionicus DSM 2379]